MLRRRLLPLLVALAAASSQTACAQTVAPPPRASVPAAVTVARAAPRADLRLERVREALAAAERGGFDAAAYADLAGHPLYGWIEYADLRRDLSALDRARAEAFLRRYDRQAVASTFRAQWLAEAARRQDWSAFDAAWQPGTDEVALRCAHLQARAALGRTDAAWTSEAQALWRESANSLPGTCDAAFAALDARGGLPPALRWERIEKAAEAWQPAVMRAAARGLPADEAALANDYAAFVDAVHERALGWPRTERSRRIASYGLARFAKSLPSQAQAQLAKYGPALGFTEADRGRVLYQAALQSAGQFDPDAWQHISAVPESAFDDRLHEWRVRTALARSDWAGALAGIRRMSGKQREDSKYVYFEGRLAEKLGDAAAARRAYTQAAAKPEFHGFLAADRIDAPYALCPWIPGDSATARAPVENDPAIVRSMALWRLDRVGWATAEWNEAFKRLQKDQRAIAVKIAQENGWLDRAVFSLGKDDPEELRLYTLRFPLDHEGTIRREAARNRLDPAFVAAEIRAESIFNPKARSGANAVGLMQVLPSTGQSVANRIGLPWNGESSLLDPDTNIALGTAYLRQLYDSFGEGRSYYTIAGYNAGPAPLNRWKSARGHFDPDFFIETITYKETRDYVARVLAFSVLYDWRLNGDALRLSDRMVGLTTGPRKAFRCPLAITPPAPPPMPAEKPKRSSRRR
ncbi:transglycosylase SLT domain-containing protein [Lysobacter humi (ex Lee et al. 2017)]